MSRTGFERAERVRARVTELRVTIAKLDADASEHEKVVRQKTGLDLSIAMQAVRKFTRASSAASKRLDSAVKAADSADRIHEAEGDVRGVEKNMERLRQLLIQLGEARMQTAFVFPPEPVLC